MLTKCLALAVVVAAGVVTPVAFASDWVTVQQRGRLVVGIKENLPPLGFKDSAGKLVGFEIDIARELAKELLGSDTAVELVPLLNRDRLRVLLADEVDLTIAQLTLTQNRGRLVDFSPPYYMDGTVVVAKRGIKTADLRDKVAIAVLKGSSTIATLQFFFPNAATIGVDSYQEGLQSLLDGKVAAFAGDRTALTSWIREHPNYAAVGEPFAARGLAIALPRGLQYWELRDRVFKIVEKWRKNGWLRDRAAFWGL